MITCPNCSSVNVKLQPSMATNGWQFIKVGIFIILLAVVLPMFDLGALTWIFLGALCALA